MRSLNKTLRTLLPIGFAIGLTLSFGTADAWAKANMNTPSPAAETAAAVRTRAEVRRALPVAVDDELIDYAQREAQAMELANFQGGDVIVIGGTALAVILIVLLILVLL
jgi:hypothetical protein